MSGTVVYLIRHGRHAVVDRVLCGRMAGVGLDALGREQARALAERLGGEDIAAVHASPQQRARETAEPIAQRLDLPVEVAPALDELDVGEWTGREFAALSNDPHWHAWNTRRGASCPPNGEDMHAVQRRVLNHLRAAHDRHRGRALAAVSHAEPIRAAILHAADIPLDEFMRVPIDPASISTLLVGDDGIRVLAINERASP